MSLEYVEYEMKSLLKMLERRFLFIEVTLSKINASIMSLERTVREMAKKPNNDTWRHEPT